MRGRRPYLATALALFGVLECIACSSSRAIPAGGPSPGEPAADSTRAGEPVPGQTVTKEVPHSGESVSEIKEREAREPLPPRGDVAIPSHRILRGDNTAAPPSPACAPAGDDTPGEPTPDRTRGY